MSTPIQHRFETPEPVRLVVQNGRGLVRVQTSMSGGSLVELDGPDAEATRVDLHDGVLTIEPPSHRLLGGDRRLDITATVPRYSHLDARLGSSDLQSTGVLRECRVKSGSGDLTLSDVGTTVVETGSGDLVAAQVSGDLQVKSGSGDVRITRTHKRVQISTGSGDVRLDEVAQGAAVKTGSGDLTVGEGRGEVGMSTGSGDLSVRSMQAGVVRAKAASGDVRVGVPAGVPVWTDVSTVTGRVESTLESAGEPGPDQQHVEVRARTVSGDVVLAQS